MNSYSVEEKSFSTSTEEQKRDKRRKDRNASKQRYGGARSKNVGSSHAQSKEKPKVAVYHPVTGEDVTPVSLLPANMTALPSGDMPIGQMKFNASELDSRANVSFSFSGATPGISDDFSGLVGEETSDFKGTKAIGDPESAATAGAIKAGADDSNAATSNIDGAAVPGQAQAEAPALTEEQLSTMHTVVIEETDTVTLMHIRGTCVAQDSADHPIVTEANKKYAALCKEVGSDLRVVRFTQTDNAPRKNKDIMAAPPATRDAEVQALGWQIYDEMQNKLKFMSDADNEGAPNIADDGDTDQDAAGADETAKLTVQVDEIVAASLAYPGCLLNIEKGIQMNGGSSSSTTGGGDATAGVEEQKRNAAVGTTSETGTLTEPMKIEIGPNTTVEQVLSMRKADEILSSDSLLASLEIAERKIAQNLYHDKHLSYRDVPELFDASLEELEEEARRHDNEGGDELDAYDEMDAEVDIVGDSKTEDELESEAQAKAAAKLLEMAEANMAKGPSLTPLWTYGCDLTIGRNVSGLAFNPENPDLLAICYSEHDFTAQNDGLILMWSLQNPDWPLHIIRAKHGVTAIDWSRHHPNLLAAGYYDGTVAVYDLRQLANAKKEALDAGSAPALESSNSKGKHKDTVWQVYWLDKGNDRGETLVSISTDGKITEWSMKKGFAHSPLMTLKRVARPGSSERIGEGIIGRQASGMAFDFPAGDMSTYFASDEDGVIHKCSCSYTEQSLEDYFGHTGPVYRLKCSPFNPDVFISCSADWTMRLWEQKNTKEVYKFQSTGLNYEVKDVTWSPNNSTVFGCVTEDGRIQIWDILVDVVEPVVQVQLKRELSEAEKKANDAKEKAKAEFQAARRHGHGQHGEDSRHAGDITADAALVTSGDGGVAPGASTDLADTSKATKRKLTCIKFAENSPVVVVGDSDGRVDVMRIENMMIKPCSVAEHKRNLKHAMYPETFGSSAVEE